MQKSCITLILLKFLKHTEIAYLMPRLHLNHLKKNLIHSFILFDSPTVKQSSGSVSPGKESVTSVQDTQSAAPSAVMERSGGDLRQRAAATTANRFVSLLRHLTKIAIGEIK